MLILDIVYDMHYKNLEMWNISASLHIGSVTVNSFYHLSGDRDTLIELPEGEMADEQLNKLHSATSYE